MNATRQSVEMPTIFSMRFQANMRQTDSNKRRTCSRAEEKRERMRGERERNIESEREGEWEIKEIS